MLSKWKFILRGFTLLTIIGNWSNKVLAHSQERASQVALVVKNPPTNAGDKINAGSVPGLGRSLEERMATHSSIIAPMDRGARLAAAHRVSKSQIRLK